MVFIGASKTSQDGRESRNIALVVVHQNGQIRCLSEDLSEEYWNFGGDIVSENSHNTTTDILYATILSLDDARKGIFRNREDLIARLQAPIDTSTTHYASSELLVLLKFSTTGSSENSNDVLDLKILNLFTDVKHSSSSRIGLRQPVNDELISFRVPELDLRHNNRSSYFIHNTSGYLYHVSKKCLRVYDFSGPAPILTQSLTLRNGIVSCVRLSSTSVVVTSASSISVLDTQYGSTLATEPIDLTSIESSSPHNDSKMSKMEREDMTLVSYFVSLGIILAIRGRSLISFQVGISDPTVNTRRKRTSIGKLINSVGRGIKHTTTSWSKTTPNTIIPEVFGRLLHGDEDNAEMQIIKAKLEPLISKDSVMEFDSLVTKALLLKTGNSGDLYMSAPPIQTATETIPRFNVNYILSKILKVQKRQKLQYAAGSTTHICLIIEFLPLNTFNYLVKEGLFSLHYIQSALKQSHMLKPSIDLHPCAVVQALVEHDPTLGLLLSLVTISSFLTARELVYAVRLGIGGFHKLENVPEQRLLTNGAVETETSSSIDTQLGNGLSDHDKVFAAGHSKPFNAQKILKQCLRRLFNHYDRDIRDALKQELSQRDLLSFINFLRMDLARGGWLSRYTDDSNGMIEEEDQENNEISIVVKLLNCAVDCLGSGGWIGGSSNRTEFDNAEMISYLKAEVSAALEGIEESAYLKNMLNEVLLYSKSTKTRRTQTNAEQSSMIRPVTVAMQSWQDSVLPIGLKADQGVGLTKIGAGGVIQERSLRDIGRLKSRKVGAYSFERILI